MVRTGLVLLALIGAGLASPAASRAPGAAARPAPTDTPGAAAKPVPAGPPRAAAAEGVWPPGVERVAASPKHPVVVLAPRDVPAGTLIIRFASGRSSERGLVGIDRMAYHALLDAQQDLGYAELASRLHAAGGTLSFVPGLDDCALVLTAPAEHFEELAGLVARLALAPKLTRRAYDRIRKRTALEMDETGFLPSIPGVVASFATHDVRYQTAGAKMGRVTRGIGWDELLAHLRGPMSPANATVVVAGPFDPKSMKRRLSRLSGGRRPVYAAPKVELPTLESVESPIDALVMLWPVELGNPERVAALRLLETMLSQLLTWELREVGVGYDVAVLSGHDRWLDYLCAVSAVAEGDLPRAYHVLNGVLASLRSPEAFPVHELEVSRGRLLGRLRSVDRDPTRLAFELLHTEVEGHWYGPAVQEAIASMSAQDLARFADRWFQPRGFIRLRFARHVSNLSLQGRRGNKGWTE